MGNRVRRNQTAGKIWRWKRPRGGRPSSPATVRRDSDRSVVITSKDPYRLLKTRRRKGAKTFERLPAVLRDTVSADHKRPEIISIMNAARRSESHTIHEIITGRRSSKIVRMLKRTTKRYNRQAAKSESPEAGILDRDDLVKRGISVLSIGEGYSNFISDLLRARARFLGKKPSELSFEEAPYAALDCSYGERSTDVIDGPRSGILVSKVVENDGKKTFPNHYHNGYAQDFRLVDSSTGKRIQFDEVVSLVSVGRFMYREFLRSKESGRALLVNMLDHVKPGGFLRIHPVTLPDIFLRIERRLFLRRINSTLKELTTEGVIAHTNLVSWRSGYLIIQKVK